MKYIVLLSLFYINAMALVNYNCKTYLRIGNITSKSGVTREQLQKLISEVEYDWERRVGLNFLEYNEKKGIPINIVYNPELNNIYKTDELKEKAEKIAIMLRKIKEEKDEKQISRDNLMSVVLQKQQAFYKLKSSKQRVVAHKELNTLITMLNKKNSELDGVVNKYNYLNTKRNEIVSQMNTLSTNKDIRIGITQSNTTVSRKYHNERLVAETVNTTVEKIDIYKYNNYEEMKKILAHEVGHAFGIKEHLNNPRALMNKRTTSQDIPFTITTDDINYAQQILLNKCKR